VQAGEGAGGQMGPGNPGGWNWAECGTLGRPELEESQNKPRMPVDENEVGVMESRNGGTVYAAGATGG